MDEVSELKTELQDLRMQLEIEKQKNTKLQKELEIAQKKAGRPGMPTAHIPKVAPRQASRPGMHIDMGDTPVTHGELTRLEKIIGEVQSKLDSIEHEKWEVQKKNIELKENLQRLKVQGTNFRKDIETVAEKVDRKENQNFKVRLELTDTRKELVTVKEEQEGREKVLAKLEKKIDEIQAQIEKYEKVLKEESFKHDKINGEYIKARDLLAKYEDHWLSKIYNR
jgi:chromosome segregation ATPase